MEKINIFESFNMKKMVCSIFILFYGSFFGFPQEQIGLRLIPTINISPNNIYKFQVGFYRDKNNAINSYRKLSGINFNLSPEYEQDGSSVRIVLRGVRGSEVRSVANDLVMMGFHEAIISEEINVNVRNLNQIENSNMVQPVSVETDVVVYGNVLKKRFYGPPNFGENPESDRIEGCNVLILFNPITFIDGTDTRTVREIQLVFDNFTNYDPNLVYRIKGRAFFSITGHHHTPVLIGVDEAILNL